MMLVSLERRQPLWVLCEIIQLLLVLHTKPLSYGLDTYQAPKAGMLGAQR